MKRGKRRGKNSDKRSMTTTKTLDSDPRSDVTPDLKRKR